MYFQPREKLRDRGVPIAATSRKDSMELPDVSTIIWVSIRMICKNVEKGDLFRQIVPLE